MENKKISVLLVEDNKLARKIETLLLEQLHCQVEAVATGQLALAVIKKTLFHIIFMDIGLPDVDGLSLIETIRNTNNLNQQTPIIALSAHSDKEYIEQSFQAGASEYIVKPFNNKIGKTILEKYAG